MSSSNANVKWAQRKDKLFITIEVTDSSDVKVDFTDQSITCTGTGKHKVGGEATPFKTVLNLSDKIDSAKSTFTALGFSIQICAIKHDPTAEHWGRLCTEPAKALKNWLSVDWGLWKDEDEEKEGEKVDFGGGGYGDMGGMGGMPGMGGMGGMPGMGGMGGMPGMGGAGGGMGGMDMQALMAQMGGMGGAGGMPGMEGGDSDDEAEPPNLEDVDGKEGENTD